MSRRLDFRLGEARMGHLMYTPRIGQGFYASRVPFRFGELKTKIPVRLIIDVIQCLANRIDLSRNINGFKRCVDSVIVLGISILRRSGSCFCDRTLQSSSRGPLRSEDRESCTSRQPLLADHRERTITGPNSAYDRIASSQYPLRSAGSICV